ncbi:MAG: hypothetical protein HOI80_00290 [Alphaproteobacteria bacterium]|nr:hypothetical protein [Alphaproteobacteria bacterium]MBT5389849.1 hypothetical protein [Alphaproteobacteria bacterium]MBT5540792.1 hypothetical protein [Alphaproteobacteria bacterium]MBT5653925.1 hypothetical protein [Alphaproteobacteria bacterium]
MRKYTSLTFIVSLLVAPLLSGCGYKEYAYHPTPCVPMALLGDLSESVQYDTDGNRSLIINLDQVKGWCEGDEETTNVKLVIQTMIQRPNTASDDSQEFSFDYFITVTDAQNDIISKMIYTALVDFDENQRKKVELIEQVISIPESSEKSIKDYRVYVGLQVDSVQLEKNRKKYARRGK